MARELPEAGGNPPLLDLKEKLLPYRCGYLRCPVAQTSASRLLFTEEEVGWYEYTSTRMYTIINGDVYDITGK
jgi:hypothetical protein